MSKGSSFERGFCTDLSRWWSGGKDDSLFWRTATSGARATVREKRGKATRGHCGDVCATDPEGEPLTRLITIELKRGKHRRSKSTEANVHDLLDRGPAQKAPTVYEEFFLQAVEAAERAGTPYWMLIHRRDQKRAAVFVPLALLTWFFDHSPEPHLPRFFPEVRIRCHCRGVGKLSIVGTTLESFFQVIRPEWVRAAARAEGVTHGRQDP
jgi:hypothetical protein